MAIFIAWPAVTTDVSSTAWEDALTMIPLFFRGRNRFKDTKWQAQGHTCQKARLGPLSCVGPSSLPGAFPLGETRGPRYCAGIKVPRWAGPKAIQVNLLQTGIPSAASLRGDSFVSAQIPSATGSSLSWSAAPHSLLNV